MIYIWRYDKLLDIWNKVKKKCSYFYERKPFIKNCLTATNRAIGKSTDPINSSKILKNRRARKVIKIQNLYQKIQIETLQRLQII